MSFFNRKPTEAELGQMNGVWRTHPRYRGMIVHLLFNEESGHPRDISGKGNHPTWVPNLGPSFVRRSQGIHGPAVRSIKEDNSHLSFSDLRPFITDNKVSSYMLHKVDRIAGIGNQTDAFGGGTPYYNFNGTVGYPATLNTSREDALAAITDLQRWHGYYASNSGADGSSKWRLYQSIKLWHSEDTGTVGFAANQRFLGGNAFAFDGWVSEFRLYNRVLPKTELISLSRDPFLEFEWAAGQTMLSNVLAGAAAPAGLTVGSLLRMGIGR